MLLYTREAACPATEFNTLANQNSAGEQSHSCSDCGDILRSLPAFRQHKSCSCPDAVYGYSILPDQGSLMKNVSGMGGGVGTDNCVVDDDDDDDVNDNCGDVSIGTESDDVKSSSDDSFQDPPETGSAREFKCDECPKSFQWRANLQRHQLTHDADRKFPCENCVKVFTDPSNLQRHIRSQHVGARCHACSECGKTFATSSGLKQHHHIHSSVKPFQCEVCLKSYTQFSNLCRHKRMHADCRQQIKCQDCGQVFSTVTSLSKHKRFCEGYVRNGMRILYPCDKGPLASPNGGQTTTLLTESLLSRIHHAQTYLPGHQQYPFTSYHNFGAFPNLLHGGMSSMLAISPIFNPEVLRIATASLQHPNSLSQNLGDEFGYNNISSKFNHELDFNIQIGSNFTHKTEHAPPLILRPAHRDNNDDSKDSKNCVRIDSVPDNNVNNSHRINQSSTPTLNCSSSNSQNAAEMHKHELTPSPMHSPDNSQSNYSKIASPKCNSPANGNSNIISTKISTFVQQNTSRSEPYANVQITSATNKPAAIEQSSPIELCPRSVLPVVTDEISDNDLYPKSDVPLDLSTKPSNNSIRLFQNDCTRKTHIYGKTGPSSTPSSTSSPPPTLTMTSSSSVSTSPFLKSKTPSPPSLPTSSYSPTGGQSSVTCQFTYPFNPLLVDSFLRMKEEIALQFDSKPDFTNSFSKFMIPGTVSFQGCHPHQFASHSAQNVDKISSMLELEQTEFQQNLKVQHHGVKPHFFSQNMPGKTKERYVCKFCGKIFPRSANLTRHLRTHTGEQPYKCKYCERSFSISSNLQRHVRNIHNKERPFKCQLCDRCFGQQTNLDRHLRKHEHQNSAILSAFPTTVSENNKLLHFPEILKISSGDRDGDSELLKALTRKGKTSVDESNNCIMGNTTNIDGEVDSNDDDDVDDIDISDEDSLSEKAALPGKQIIQKHNVLAKPLMLDNSDNNRIENDDNLC